MMAIHEGLNLAKEISGSEILRSSNVVDELQNLAFLIKSQALHTDASAEMFRVQNALATYQFHQGLMWSFEHLPVRECRAAIRRYCELGYTSISHILQIRLLQVGIGFDDSEMQAAYNCWQTSADQTARYLRDTPLDIPVRFRSCQLFTPRELVRVSAFARTIIGDERTDYLGRSSFHILFDAGVPVEWPLYRINQPDLLGRTAVHQGLCRRDEITVSKLLSQGANLNLLCLGSSSVLHIAAIRGHANMVKCLIDRVPHLVNEPDVNGRTPFWHAANNSHLSVMKFLGLMADVDITREDNNGHNAFAAAAKDGRYDVLGNLYKLRSDKAKKLGVGHWSKHDADHVALLIASSKKHIDCVQLIVAHRLWKAGDADFNSIYEKAKHRNDVELQKRLKMLWTVDGTKVFEIPQVPAPTAKRLHSHQAPLPQDATYCASFGTKTWDAWHCTHAQSNSENGSFSSHDGRTAPATA